MQENVYPKSLKFRTLSFSSSYKSLYVEIFCEKITCFNVYNIYETKNKLLDFYWRCILK